ncbi:MAG: HEPN domain-containing protein [Bacteroidetes bacterium]|nr:HEPN domain-containing protein [Bacteroidota bacterium]
MNSEPNINSVLRKAKDKLKTAYIDFENGQYDDAVSRAYYAVYHAMTAALLFKGQVYSSHSRTIGAFNRDLIKSGVFPKNFTRMIHDLFDDRQLGDYDVDMSFEREIAEKNIKNAEMILSAVEKYLFG